MDIHGKKLLVQGAGRGHLGLMRAAIEMGVYTVVTGLPGKYPCTSLADKICYANIADPNAILAVAEKESVDGIVICCSDTGLQAVGHVCDKMQLCGLSEKSAKIASDKLLMKQALMDCGVRTAKYKKLVNKDDLQEAISELSFPVIVKATDLQGSRGIYIVKDVASLESVFDKVMSETKRPYCIVEEFIEGKEFGAQSFIYNGEVLFTLPHGDETVTCNTAVPIGHYIPLDITDSDLYNDIIQQAKNAIKAIGLDNCAVNIDFILKDNKVYVIELTGRVGANCLPELTSNYLGVNYYKMIIAMALGEDPREIFQTRSFDVKATLSKMIKSNKSGIVDSINYPDLKNDGIVEMFITKDSEVRQFTNSNDAIGQIIVVGECIEECRDKVQIFEDNFDMQFK